jgi:hypothetical protein
MFPSVRLVAIASLSCFPALSLHYARAQTPEPTAIAIPSTEELIRRIKPAHPRLLTDAAGFEALRNRIASDPVLKRWDAKLLQDAERFLNAKLPEHVLPDGLRLLDTSRRLVDHSYTLTMAYRLHGDKRYRDRLWHDLETVAKFPDFNPKHFLDTAEMTHALGIAYDWLYDEWTESQRETIRRAIVNMGLKPGLRVYESKGGWPRMVHNWNQVCNGGLTVGALAIADKEPELCGKILHHALTSVQLAMRSYAPDGGWGEGPGYWTYATSYNVTMIACLESAAGSDFGLSKFPGFDQTVLFPLYMNDGANRWFNFADCAERAGRPDCLFWLGLRFHQPAAEWLGATMEKASPAGMLWYRSPGKDPAAAGMPLDKYWRNVEVATFRGRWNDPNALFAGIEARSHAFNHQHLDIGSFVLDSLGQRWAVDLGSDDYNLPGYFGGKRYDYYRLRAEGHNTLVIDPTAGPDQDAAAACRIRRFVSKPEMAFAIADLTNAYGKRAKRVERGMALVDRRYVIVQDEIESATGDGWWFMHTPADVHLESDGRTALLTLKGKQLEARIVSPAAGVHFEVRAAEPLPSSPHPTGQKDNGGTRKLAIRLPQSENLQLTVAFIPHDGQGKVESPKVRPLAEW